MPEGQKEFNLSKEFEDLFEQIDRYNNGLHQHLFRIDEERLDKIISLLTDFDERLKSIEETMKAYRKELSELEVEISDIQTKMDQMSRTSAW